MSININEAMKLAKLSRLEFTESELQQFVIEFEQTLEQVKAIEKVDCANIDLHENTINAEQQLRADSVVSSLPLDKIIKNAPVEKDGAFLVPITVE